MQPAPDAAPESKAMRLNNGHDDTGTPGIILRHGLPMPILPQAQIPSRTRHLMIQTAAYFLAQQRGFVPGNELGDWLAAEALIGHELSGSRSSS